jgi:hypothetical protein
MGEVEGDQSSRKGCGSRSSRRLDVMKRDSAKSLFGSVVAVAFQIAFRAKMHANDVFLFFKNHF